MTSEPDEPVVKSFVKEHADVVAPPPVETGVPPEREAWTFAIVALSAPKDWSSEMMAENCELVSAAACAIGASESIDVAIASPVATAATFAIAFVVTIFITIVNDFKST